MNWLKRSLTGLALFVTFLVIPLYGYKVYTKTDYTDFSVYYKAGVRAQAQAWDQIYNLGDGASPFRYVPTTLPFFTPFALLPPQPARLVWYFFQLFCLGLGFWLLSKTLRLITHQPALVHHWILSATFLFILRFCLDSFTIGQITPLMFLGFSFSLYAWVLNRPALASAGLFIPALLKIGPALGFGLFAASRLRYLKVAIAITSFISVLTLGIGVCWSYLTTGSYLTHLNLWKEWAYIVQADSAYYDASHYGSQSIKSALLRLSQSGLLTLTQANEMWVILSLFICSITFLFWILRRPTTLGSRASFFCLGLFPYLWIMPETFKYAFTFLAFPVLTLLTQFTRLKPLKPHPLTLPSLVFTLLTLSLAGKDLLPNAVFFGLQQYSLPLVATFFLGCATFFSALRESKPSRLAQNLKELFSPTFLGPWKRLPASVLTPSSERAKFSFIIPVRLDPYHAVDTYRLSTYIHEAHREFSILFGDSFELQVVFFGSRASLHHEAYLALLPLTHKFSQLHLNFSYHAEGATLSGRAAALREGFLNSRGHFIAATHFEQPCHFSFFKQAHHLLSQDGADIVRADRRSPQSQFIIPVKWLSVVYQRHRLGLAFNSLVRFILPITTRDTHSGSFVMSSAAASEIFALHTSSDFLLDLEISLVAQAQGFREVSLPVTLTLAEEKTQRTMLNETLCILVGLPTLAWRHRKNYYQAFESNPVALTADDWGLSPATNLGMLELARRGLLKRISALADSPYLKTHLLEALEAQVTFGLHFNMTYGKAFGSPGEFLISWFFKRKQTQTLLLKELRSQLQKMKDAGVPARYLDSHHHIHAIPGVLTAIAPVLKEFGIHSIRSPLDSALWWNLNKAPLNLLAWLSSREFKRAECSEFKHLPFSYPQKKTYLDQGRLRRYLHRHASKEVLFHPATEADVHLWTYPDSYQGGRVQEYLALQMLHPFHERVREKSV